MNLSKKPTVPCIELNTAILFFVVSVNVVRLIKNAHAAIAFLLLFSALVAVLSFTVTGQVLNIDIEFISKQPAYVNQAFEIAATVSGGTPPYSYQWYTKWFPPWQPGMDPGQYRASSGSEIAVLDATSATFLFTPTVEGIYWIGVGVSDSAGNSVSRFPSIQPLQLIVNNPVLKSTSKPYPVSPEFTARLAASSLEVTIENQPTTTFVTTNNSNPSLYYGFRFKDHNETFNWNYDPIYYVGSSSYGTYYKASNSDYTVVTFPLWSYPLKGILDGGKVDLQVISLIGKEVPTKIENGTVFGFDGVESNWSEIQTVDIPASSPSPSPTPMVPEFSWSMIFPLLVFGFSVAVILRYRNSSNRGLCRLLVNLSRALCFSRLRNLGMPLHQSKYQHFLILNFC